MTKEIKEWLNNRLINPDKWHIEWDGSAIKIPIFDRQNNLLFYKYRRSPFKNTGPKYWYTGGTSAALFNSAVIDTAQEIIICEGEFDCMVLNDFGFAAVSSTGGCGTFLDEWGALLAGKRIYICFDSDNAGKKAAAALAVRFYKRNALNIIMLPDETKDITEYFLKFGPETFRILKDKALNIWN